MNNIFIAKGDDKVLSRIVVEHYEKRYIVESPYSDEQPLEVLPEMVYTILLMSGYSEGAINDKLVELAREHGAKIQEEEDE